MDRLSAAAFCVCVSAQRMKSLVILFALAAYASADVGLGYHYKVPHTSYGVPSYQPSGGSYNLGSESLSSASSVGSSSAPSQPQYQSVGSSQNLASYHGSQSGILGSGYQGYQESQQGYQKGSGYQTGFQGVGNSLQYQQPTVNVGYQTGNVGYQTGSGSLGYQTGSGGLGYQTGSTSSVQTGAGNLGQALNAIDQRFHTSEKTSSQSSYQNYYQQYQQQAPQVFKHFYVHAAPEEPEAPHFRQPPVLPPPQKHYKIIFIKTPSPPAPAIQYVPLQQQNEEKTIVYVLVKKPEEAGEIVLPKVQPKPPSKPEVFFIKYNAKEGHQGVINNIVNDYGGNANAVGSAVSQSSGSGSTVGPTFVDGALADSFSSTVSSGITGGSSSGGSYSVSHGTSENVLSSGSSGYVQEPITTVTSSDTLVGGLQSGAETQVQGGYADTQKSSFETVSANQGLPHTSYGPPNFRS